MSINAVVSDTSGHQIFHLHPHTNQQLFFYHVFITMSENTITLADRMTFAERVNYSHNSIMALKNRFDKLENEVKIMMETMMESQKIAEEAKKMADHVAELLDLSDVLDVKKFIDDEAEEVEEDDQNDNDNDEDFEVVFVGETFRSNKKRRLC